MPSKRSVIAALVGINLFLLAALILSSYSPPAAYAQRVGGAWNYIAVSCEVDESYDVFYLVDLGDRRLHAFVPSQKQDGSIEYVGSRSLESDFRRSQQ
ncbi:MAG: hypothetical protein ACYSUI_22685 [Planctomycetota bacterium]